MSKVEHLSGVGAAVIQNVEILRQLHLEMLDSQLKNNTEEHILLGQVFQAGREASNCLHCQYRVVAVERMARLMELDNWKLEKSFWGKETANVDGSGMFCCLYLL